MTENKKMNLDQLIEDTVKQVIASLHKEVETDPSEAQIKVGNYKKGHLKLNGFNISIEQPKGSIRSGTDKSGKKWSIKMNNDYGYFISYGNKKARHGQDGDEVDVFLGNKYDSKKIFVIDQFLDGKFDESKVFLLVDSKEEAKSEYLKNYEKGWKGCKYVTEVDEETFKKWLYDGKHQHIPFAKYNYIKSNKINESKAENTFYIKSTGWWLEDLKKILKKYNTNFEVIYDDSYNREEAEHKEYSGIGSFEITLVYTDYDKEKGYEYEKYDGEYKIVCRDKKTCDALKDIFETLGSYGNCGHTFTYTIKHVNSRKRDTLEFDGDGHDNVQIIDGFTHKDNIIDEDLEYVHVDDASPGKDKFSIGKEKIDIGKMVEEYLDEHF